MKELIKIYEDVTEESGIDVVPGQHILVNNIDETVEEVRWVAGNLKIDGASQVEQQIELESGKIMQFVQCPHPSECVEHETPEDEQNCSSGVWRRIDN